MGQIKFIVPAHSRFDPDSIGTVFMMGLDQIPWPCTVMAESQEMVVERKCSDSGRLLMAIKFPELGEIVVSTATLPERDEPYVLPVELVRGTLNRLNNQLFLWKEGGLDVPQEFTEANEQLNDRLSQLVFCESPEKCVDQAIELLDDIVARIFELASKFSEFVVNLRIQHDGVVKSVVGFILNGQTDDSMIELQGWINCICFPTTNVEMDYSTREFDWTPVENLQRDYEGEIRLTSYGPMLDFGRKQLPEWLSSDDTFDLQRQAAANFARGYARTLSKKTQLAYVAAGLNGILQRTRSFPNQLQLTVDMLEAIENVRTDINTMVSFDQPWGERLAWTVGGTHAMHIADTLLRHGLHISCFGLEINLDYWPHGSLYHDPLHWVDLIDHWSQFGVPLFVILSAPILESKEVAIDPESQAYSTLRKKGVRLGMNREQLTSYLETVIKVLLAKPIVNGIVWRQWQDESDSRFPASGLICENGNTKSIEQLLQRIGTVVQGNLEAS